MKKTSKRLMTESRRSLGVNCSRRRLWGRKNFEEKMQKIIDLLHSKCGCSNAALAQPTTMNTFADAKAAILFHWSKCTDLEKRNLSHHFQTAQAINHAKEAFCLSDDQLASFQISFSRIADYLLGMYLSIRFLRSQKKIHSKFCESQKIENSTPNSHLLNNSHF